MIFKSPTRNCGAWGTHRPFRRTEVRLPLLKQGAPTLAKQAQRLKPIVARSFFGTVEEFAEKVKNAVIPRSEATRNLLFVSKLRKSRSLAALGMTVFLLFSATSETVS